MTGRRYTLATVLGILLTTAGLLTADEPHLGYVFPAGGCQGATLELTIGGQFLEGTSGVVFTGGGLRGKVTGYHKELTQQEIGRLRRRMETLEQTVGDATGKARDEMEAEMAELREQFREQGFEEDGKKRLKGNRPDPRKQPNAQLREQVTLQCRIDPDAAPGVREFRLQTPAGLSNAILFHVGRTPERRETEPNDREPAEAERISPPTVVNGQVLPGDIDRFRIAAVRGQRLVCKVAARSLVPYLADAVPGWFQAALTLYDGEGKELIFVDDDHFDPDPLLVYDVPADGDYILEIRDAIYRGREDFTYRLTIADGVTMDGPLPSAAHGPDPEPGDVAEAEPNHDPAPAQPVRMPVMLRGRIEPAGDTDVYAFEGRAGQSIVIETMARRAGSPLDSVLQLTGPDGQVIAVNDDHVDRGQGLVTHHADSYIHCDLPADGRYAVRVGDIQGKGSAEHIYRLRIGTAQPDFELRVTPATLSIPAGGTAPLTVHVLRRDGFTGPVTLVLTGTPGGCRLSGSVIPAGEDKMHATLSVPWKTEDGLLRPALEGRAVIGGRTVRHAAVPAEDQMQAFLWRHLVPVKDWVVSVSGKTKVAVLMDRPASGPLELVAGEKTEVVLRQANPKNPIRGRPRFELFEPPAGLTLAGNSYRSGGREAVLELAVDETALKPGAQGQLIVDVLGSNAKVRKVLGTIPAVPFKVVSR